MTSERARFNRRGTLPTTGAVSVASAFGTVADACGRPEHAAVAVSTDRPARASELGKLKAFSASDGQNQGDLNQCVTSYGVHDSKRLRPLAETGWVELDPAFPYVGQSMRLGRRRPGTNVEDVDQARLQAKNQFALELDDIAATVHSNRPQHTPGEEGMQEMRIIAAIYEAAQSGSNVRLPAVAGLDAFRGPAPS